MHARPLAHISSDYVAWLAPEIIVLTRRKGASQTAASLREWARIMNMLRHLGEVFDVVMYVNIVVIANIGLMCALKI